jgi:hypothetical protein
MKDMQYYDGLPWDIRIERDRQHDGTVYYMARHPEFAKIGVGVRFSLSPYPSHLSYRCLDALPR